MQVVILGAGIVGLSAAWALARDGHAVTVIDREAAVGMAASHANGGQLSYSYVTPLASPAVFGDLARWLLRSDSPVRFRPTADPQQWRWLLSFLMACNGDRARRTTRRLLELAALSRRELHTLIAEHAPAFDHAQPGKLVLYGSPSGLDKAKGQIKFQSAFGCRQMVLDRDACIAVEPALADFPHPITGGIHTPDEEVGDCFKLCRALEGLLRAKGARLLLGTEVRRLLPAGGRIIAAETQRGAVEGDAFVLASGVTSRDLARPLGLDLPLYPIRGYSVTLPALAGRRAPVVSITDYDRRIVYARLGEVVRVAGIADLVGWSREADTTRTQLLQREARNAFPGSVGFAGQDAVWVGLRPATPTGLPLLGRTRFDNLLLDTGHGALGFTLAMGSARIIADLLAGREPEIAPEPVPPVQQQIW